MTKTAVPNVPVLSGLGCWVGYDVVEGMTNAVIFCIPKM